MCSLQLRSGTGLVRVAHLGEGEFLNDHPLLVQVMPLISAIPFGRGSLSWRTIAPVKLGQRRLRAAGQEESQGWRSKWCCLMSSTGAAVQTSAVRGIGWKRDSAAI